MLGGSNLEPMAAVVKPPEGRAREGDDVEPRSPSQSGVADAQRRRALISSEPPAPNTKYSVRFEFKGADAMEWSFTTAAK